MNGKNTRRFVHKHLYAQAYERIFSMQQKQPQHTQPHNPWNPQLTTVSIALIPAAIGINYVGKMFAAMLKLPLWLDSIGSCIAACLAGPIVGAISGVLTNIIYGLTLDSISTVYGVTQAGIAICVGLFAWYGRFSKPSEIFVAGLCAGLVAVLISTPLNMIFWGGTTGNVWGDAVFAAMGAQGYLASLADELVVDIPDKIVVVFVVAGIYRALPQNLLSLHTSHDIEDL